MNLAEKLSHDDVRKRMQFFLLSGLAADNKTLNEDELSFKIGPDRFVIIAPVEIAQAASLEQKIKDNSSNGVATCAIFPKSHYNYDGNYLKESGSYEYFAGGKKRWHNTSRLNSVERYIADTFEKTIPYYNPLEDRIEVMGLRKLPETFIADMLKFRPFGEVEGDKEILALGRQLKEKYGSGYSRMITNESKRARYVQLERIERRKDQLREKNLKSVISGSFTLVPYTTKKGLIGAKIAPYQLPSLF